MPVIDFEPWEPEETIGKLWHGFASRLDAPDHHDDAAVALNEVGGRLAVFFRGLGGSHSVEIKPVADIASAHRLSWRRRLGTAVERIGRPSFDGEVLRLPQRIANFPDREANVALYFWLTASVAHAPESVEEDDPLRADLRALIAADAMTRETIAACPGLIDLHRRLAEACRIARKTSALPRREAAVEQIVLAMLGDTKPPDGDAADLLRLIHHRDADLSDVRAPRRYKPFMPVPLWPDLRPFTFGAHSELETPDTVGPPQENAEGIHQAKRKKADLADRRDSLILHKFEAILSWAEFLNLNRRVDDDDLDSAKKALDDADEIGLGEVSKAPATRLKLHLDLAPEDVDRERLSTECTYPEWDVRTGVYLIDHCRVFASEAKPSEEPAAFTEDPRAKRRVHAVRRQFEALRPRRVSVPSQPDGDDLDLDAVVRARADLLATGQGSNRIWRDVRTESRDLAVSILLDTSRSTESAVGDRAVIDIAREALAALAWGLTACGDDCAIHAFSSLRRDRVYLRRCKDFSEEMGPEIERRIAGLHPGFYTRLGTAIRHASADLARQVRQRRLLLVITDGKPNDLDHYEGRHGIEDTRMAIREARRVGQAVFGITIDAQSKTWFPRMFGRGGFAVIPEPDKLINALPEIYRQLVGA